jgi:hypothetical protein
LHLNCPVWINASFNLVMYNCGTSYQGNLMKIRLLLRNFAVILVCLFTVVESSLPPADRVEQIRTYTRTIEFDYITWTLNAFFVKTEQTALNLTGHLSDSQQVKEVKDYLQLVQEIDNASAQIEEIYSDPNVKNPAGQAHNWLNQLHQLEQKRQQLGALAESVLQSQVSATLAANGLTLGGQPVPPVLYHVTPLPMALIISPRNIIRQDANISLQADLNLDQIDQLENQIQKSRGVSALVVPVGGVGVYPTMVESTTDLPWVVSTIAHEWTHNFLTLRPLGLSYEASPELRTMNETTADIVGTEIGDEIIKRYYPEYLPPPPPLESSQSTQAQNNSNLPKSVTAPVEFNFRAEMHTTRITVDKMLAEGKIKGAEDYMEARRRIFWDHGYQIRRLNQAYFAFYGAYADVPGGAAGNDPVGPAVRALRAQSPSLLAFLNRISWMTSFDQLKSAIKN